MKHLDRLGSAASKDFYIVSSDQVLRYVKFDIEDCNLFTLGNLILKQGVKGVPIGGFLSAQLAELWAIWREEMTLFGHLRGATEDATNRELAACGDTYQCKPPTLRLLG